MKVRPTITYEPGRDGFVLVMPAGGAKVRVYVLSPEEAIDLRIGLRRELWRRAEELGEHGR